MIHVLFSLGTESRGWAAVLMTTLARAPARFTFCAEGGLARSLEKLVLST